MNRELVTYQTYESPKKTGGVVIGVTLLTLGLAILILYLVKESRKPDEEELRRLINGEPTPKSQTSATTVSGLLDELFAFGSPPKTEAQQSSDDTLAEFERVNKILEERERTRRIAAQDAEVDQFFADAQAERDAENTYEEVTNLQYYQIP